MYEKSVTVEGFGEDPSLIRHPTVQRVRVFVEWIFIEHFVVSQVLVDVARHGGLTSEYFGGMGKRRRMKEDIQLIGLEFCNKLHG